MRSNYQVNQWMNPIAAALLGNVLYILLVLGIKEVGKFFPIGGTVNLIYNLVAMGIALLFWMLYFAYITRNIIDKRHGGFFKYIFLTNLPIFIFVGVTTFLTYYSDVQGFSANWNAFNFVVAPSLFWFLPFGAVTYVWDTISLPLWVYPYLALLLILLFQSLGIALTGQYRRKILHFTQERLKRLEEQEAADYAQLTAKAIQLQQIAHQDRKKKKKKIDKSRVWERDSTQIVYTESFDLVTDEMIEAYNQQQKEQPEAIVEVEEADTPLPEATVPEEPSHASRPDGEHFIPSDHAASVQSQEDAEALPEGMFVPAQKREDNAEQAPEASDTEDKQETPDSPIEEQLDESKMKSKNIQAELDKIRDLINCGKLK
jgi:hypothetical protein|nr:hypothetical protein [Eubacteriaceae bacterium]